MKTTSFLHAVSLSVITTVLMIVGCGQSQAEPAFNRLPVISSEVDNTDDLYFDDGLQVYDDGSENLDEVSCLDENDKEVACPDDGLLYTEDDLENYVCVDENDNEVECTADFFESDSEEFNDTEDENMCYDDLGDEVLCDY